MKAINAPAANHQTLAASGDYLYLANGIEGLKVIRRDIHLLQAKINDWGMAPESSPQINRGLIHGNLAFAAENNTFQIFDISELNQPVQISELVDDALAGAWVADLAIAGNHLFRATGRGLQVINFENPRAPKLVTSFNPSAEYRKISLTGTLLAALRYEREPTSSFVELFDISDPQNLRLLTNIAPTNGYNYAIAFSSNHLCVAGGPLFQVFDVTFPANPQLAGEFTLDLPEWARPEIAVSNGYAYLLHERIISVIDLNNPRNPQRIHSFEPTLNPFIPRSISISGSYLWLGGFTRAFGDGWMTGGAAQVLDISDQKNPQPLADYYLPPGVDAPCIYPLRQGCVLFHQLRFEVSRTIDSHSHPPRGTSEFQHPTFLGTHQISVSTATNCFHRGRGRLEGFHHNSRTGE